MPNGVYFWDLTIWCVEDFDTQIRTFKEWCRANCKQWIFQLERAPTTDKLHLQCRINLIDREEVLRIPHGWQGWATKTSNSTAKGKRKFKYVLKAHTRVDGPWSDRDVEHRPSSLPEPGQYNLWQGLVWQNLREQNDRDILFVQNARGAAGKTTFIKMLICDQKAILIPSSCENSQQMGGYFYDAVHEQPEVSRYVVIDLPRALTEHAWFRLAPMIEMIKDGYACDGRNHARFTLVESPKVMVCYNNLPNGHELKEFYSEDRIQHLRI